MIYFDLSTLNLVANALKSFQPKLQWQRLFGTFNQLRKCDFIVTFSADGTRVEI